MTGWKTFRYQNILRKRKILLKNRNISLHFSWCKLILFYIEASPFFCGNYLIFFYVLIYKFLIYFSSLNFLCKLYVYITFCYTDWRKKTARFFRVFFDSMSTYKTSKLGVSDWKIKFIQFLICKWPLFKKLHSYFESTHNFLSISTNEKPQTSLQSSQNFYVIF